MAWLRVGEKTEVYLDNGCIIVEGQNEDELTRSADRLVYHVLEVMP